MKISGFINGIDYTYSIGFISLLKNMLEITDKFKAFLKGYGVKSMKEYYGLTQKEKSNLAKEYLRVINKRVYPMGENGVGKILQSIVDEMPTYGDPDNDYDRERDNSIGYDF